MEPAVKSVALPNEVRIPYVEQGNPAGIPVVLLHGFADSWRSFQLVLSHLPEFIHALAPTQRGHGDASHPGEGYRVTDFASDVAAFLDAVRVSKAVIVGHSMGSAVALRFAIDHPDRTMGVVVVGAAPGLHGTEAARTFWESALAKMTDPVDSTLVRQMTETSLAKPVPRAFLEAMTEDGVMVPAFVWKAAMQSRWRLEGDFSTELGSIHAPTLIVWGDRDVRYSRAAQEALASAIAGSRLVVYEGAGHFAHWEEPDRFAADLAGFVEKLGTLG
ncbi:MAG: alpha/beta fold hydrolase [Actinomycetota bacterium]